MEIDIFNEPTPESAPKPPKFTKIRSWLGSKACGKDLIWVFVLYLAGVAVHFLLGNFSKRLTVYADELLYYTGAQSIFNGNGLMFINAHASFNKMLYSLVLSPLFTISNPVLRISMINLFNSELIMTAVFFVFLIGKEIDLNRGSIISALLITLLFPDMLYSISFMSENLNWPLTLLAIYLWLRSKRSRREWAYAASFGAVCYLGYLCKDIFLALFLSYILFELAYPLLSFLVFRKSEGKRLAEYYNKRSLIACGAAAAVFVVCFILGNAVMYGGGDSNAAKAVTGGLSRLKDPYTFVFMLYAFVYYLSACLIAVLVMPVVDSALNFKNMSENTRRLFSFLSLYLMISCAMIAYTISINEDIGKTVFRLNMRYLGYILLLLIVVFLKVLQERAGKDSGKKHILISCIAAVFPCIIYKGVLYTGVTDQTVLNLYEKALEKIPVLKNASEDKIFYPLNFVMLMLFVTVILLVHYFKSKRKGIAVGFFSVIMLGVCFLNSRLELQDYTSNYIAHKEFVDGMMTVNKYFDTADGGKRILYISDSSTIQAYSTVLTTYNNYAAEICYTHADKLAELADENNVVNVADSDFNISFFGWTFTYDKQEGFDYIITDCSAKVELSGVTRIDEASGVYYTVYKNNDPETVTAVKTPG